MDARPEEADAGHLLELFFYDTVQLFEDQDIREVFERTRSRTVGERVGRS